MIRVVLDTNIIVSALLQALGAPARVFLFGR
jgi:predicted nucleic acid-binding protein